MTKHFCVILAFLNGCISVKTSLINTKLGYFVNIGGSIVAYPIIYRLIPSPFRLDIRQCQMSRYVTEISLTAKAREKAVKEYHLMLSLCSLQPVIELVWYKK